MIVQISSGQGPAECELAVAKLYAALQQEFPDIEFLSSHEGRERRCMRSVLFSARSDLSGLEGSVLWICKSPYRPHHPRKNWYVDVSIIPDEDFSAKVREEEYRWEAFRCGGKGGQNVNKVETGVRLTHIPTGITVTSTAQRSQYANKRDALCKLHAILREREGRAKARQVNEAWQEHTRIVRGNPVRVYEGEGFVRK